jgi:MoxR-like ATPase
VTIDGATHPLPEGFIVVATQNPVEQEGTYPLPEAQLDRFLLKLNIGYPPRDVEREIVRRHGTRTAMPRLAEFGIKPLANLAALREARAAVATVRLSDEIVDYLVDLVRATREHPSLHFGASPRAANMLAAASRAFAALSGRDFAIPDDIKALYLPAMRHRVVLSPGAEVEGLRADAVLEQILAATPAPR